MPPAPNTKALGLAAEKAAVRFLKAHGYVILARNFSTSRGELDIIAADGETLCFIEVRSRMSRDFIPPHASVNRAKQARLRATAASFVTLKRLQNRLCRFDVVSLVHSPDQKSGWDIELLKDAF